MRKGALLVAFAAALLFIGTACDTVVTLEKPNVTYEAINSGAALRLTWTAVTDAKNYEITTDDSTYTVASTVYSFDVTTPSATVEVRAVNGSDKSDPATIDLTLAPTASIDVYGTSDPDTTHRSGFGFGTDGTITTYSLTSSNYPSLDFYMDDVNLSPIGLVNPGDKGWNSKGNAVAVATSTDLDSCTVAPAPGTYLTQQTLASGGVYYLWLDRTNDGWTADDNYAKAKILSITGPKVTMQVAYQKVKGIRWLK